MNEDAEAVRQWWQTSIIDMAPGRIAFRGHPIQGLIGNVSFAQMIWLMTRGDLPTEAESALLETALVAGVDHGPQAPSIAAARMAATCGVGLNNVMATGVNMLGDVHGGTGEQCAELYLDIAARLEDGIDLKSATKDGIAAWRETYGKIVSGFGHRFHKPVDPRATPDGPCPQGRGRRHRIRSFCRDRRGRAGRDWPSARCGHRHEH